MRHTYRLSDQTRKALKGFSEDIAEEMDVTPQAISAYLSDAQTDPYAKFRPLFKAIARVNPDGAAGYLKDLSAVYELATRRAVARRDISDLTGDIGREFVEFMQSRMKGMPLEIQEQECMDILQVVCETMKNLKEARKFGRERQAS